MTSLDRAHGGRITELLRQATQGNKEAFDRALALVYDELKILAHAHRRLERTGDTLDTTALVHEVYLRLVDQDHIEWQSRSHFFAVASRAMRRILIDAARARRADKRGGDAVHLSLEDAAEAGAAALVRDGDVDELLAIDDLLDRLTTFNPRGALVVEYRLFRRNVASGNCRSAWRLGDRRAAHVGHFQDVAQAGD